MQSLDLRISPPRRSRAELDGITFLPRSIDKVRGTLDGGNFHDFKVEGFTTTMLEKFGIGVDDFTQAVRSARSDDDVAAYVREHAKAGSIQEWNDFITHRQIYNGDRAEAIAENPWLADHPELVYSIDFLDYIDEHGL